MANEPITDIPSLEKALAQIRKAQAVYSTFLQEQEQVDRIFFAAAKATHSTR